MGHSAAVWDHRASLELSKDWNGIEQVMLRNPQGASARVRFYEFLCEIRFIKLFPCCDVYRSVYT